MPVIYTREDSRSALVLWKITEVEADLCAMVSQNDTVSAERFRSDERRIQHLAWRAALRELAPGGEVVYTEEGAPYIRTSGDPVTATDLKFNNTIHIGAAHTVGMAAVIIGVGPCGVDVEWVGRDFSRSAARFISPAERSLPGSDRPEFPAAVWCAKEALYKFSGRRELDFLRDMEVTSIDFRPGHEGVMPVESCGTMRGRLCAAADIALEFVVVEGCMAVWIS